MNLPVKQLSAPDSELCLARKADLDCRRPSSSQHLPLWREHEFFPCIGAVNPSLTAIANALRVGDHLLERLN